MQTKILFLTVNGNIVHKILWRLLVLGSIIALIGCTQNMMTAGNWIGKTDNGMHILEFTVGTNIVVYSYSYPCNGKVNYVLPPKPIKSEIIDSAFTITIDYTDLNPKIILIGKFIDTTHIEGTWETFKYQNIYFGTVCPAAKGSWKGAPE